MLLGCNSDSGSVAFSHQWHDVFGNTCGKLKPGCTYLDSKGKDKAIWWDDPSYQANWSNPPVLATVFDTDLGYFVEAYGNFGFNGVFYEFFTGRAVNEYSDAFSRDVLATEGSREEEVIGAAAKEYALRYQLSEDVALRAARTLNDWNKIAKSRSRTESDVIDFAERLYGVDIRLVQNALQDEDDEALSLHLETAARSWNTSPENMRRILRKVFLTGDRVAVVHFKKH